MSDSLVNIVNDLDSDNVVVEFCRIFGLSSLFNGAAKNCDSSVTAVYLHVVALESFRDHWQELFGNVLVDKEAFDSIADGGTLSFGIVGDLNSHIEVGRSINVNVAVSCACFDNRNSCVADNCLNEICTSARNNNVNIAVKAHKFVGSLAVGVFYDLNYISRQTGGSNSLTHDLAEADV